jgi:hypothetical protein
MRTYHFLHYLARYYRGWLFTVCLLSFYHLCFRVRVIIPSTQHVEVNVESKGQNYPHEYQHTSPSPVFFFFQSNYVILFFKWCPLTPEQFSHFVHQPKSSPDPPVKQLHHQYNLMENTYGKRWERRPQMYFSPTDCTAGKVQWHFVHLKNCWYQHSSKAANSNILKQLVKEFLSLIL